MGDLLYAEDFPVGRTFEFDSYSVTAEEIKSFASDWDPMPFHTDERAAEESAFGGLVASGAHTLAICIRLASDAVVSKMAVIAGRGMSEARFHQPVRPGMRLTGTMTITDQQLDGRAKGEIELRNELYDQEGNLVMSMVGEIILRRRESAAAEQST
jgi:acyl dehydratase